MPTATPSDAAPKADQVNALFTDAAKQTSDQFISAVRQSTKLGLDTASAWFETLTAGLPAVPPVPAASKAFVEQWVAASFDTAESVLALQREVASDVVAKLVPAGK